MLWIKIFVSVYATVNTLKYGADIQRAYRRQRVDLLVQELVNFGIASLLLFLAYHAVL